MKKDLLLIAAAATMLTACVNMDTLNDVEKQIEGDGSIGFLTSSEKTTKGSNSAENSNAYYIWSFINNHDNFAVWGFKSNAPTKPVFGSALSEDKSTTGVTVDASDGYSYSPLRFWDKTATSYYFYAAAPAELPIGEAWTLNYDDETTDISVGYFTTTSTLTRTNLKNLPASGTSDAVGPGTTLSEYFKGSGEIDRLIADKCPVEQSRYASSTPDKVHLNFIHILSKLNITIKTSLGSTYNVILKEFEIFNMPVTGNFNESTAAVKAGSNARWTPDNAYDNKQTYEALTNVPANTTDGTNAGQFKVKQDAANYILESLVIPQNIMYERVALDGGAHAEVPHADPVYFTDYEEYTKYKVTEALTEEQFNDIKSRLTTDATDDEKAGITKIPEKAKIEAYTAVDNTETFSSQPYFKITYSINGEDFTAYYNLAAAFKQLSNNEILTGTDALTDEQKTFAFNEGWQNTLNIIINPTAIEFTADVAKWDKVATDPEIQIIK